VTPTRCAALLPVVGSLLGATACVSLPDYPKEWPPVASANSGGCPAIEGTYDDKPVAFSRGWETDNSPNTLSSLLLLHKDARAFQGDRVDLRLRDGQLTVVGYDQGKQVVTRVLHTKTSCEQSMLVVVTDNSFAMDPFSASVLDSREWCGLSLATDGALIVEKHFSGGGTILLVPVAFVRRGWIQYRPTSSPNPALADPEAKIALPNGDAARNAARSIQLQTELPTH
jgi:hypothetical protein